jgi:hypothetical protein
MMYSPGGTLKRPVTSRRLMNAGDLPTDFVFAKKSAPNRPVFLLALKRTNFDGIISSQPHKWQIL